MIISVMPEVALSGIFSSKYSDLEISGNLCR